MVYRIMLPQVHKQQLIWIRPRKRLPRSILAHCTKDLNVFTISNFSYLNVIENPAFFAKKTPRNMNKSNLPKQESMLKGNSSSKHHFTGHISYFSVETKKMGKDFSGFRGWKSNPPGSTTHMGRLQKVTDSYHQLRERLIYHYLQGFFWICPNGGWVWDFWKQ